MMSDFLQSLQAKVGISSQNTLQSSPPTSSPIHYSLMILSFNTIQGIVKQTINKHNSTIDSRPNFSPAVIWTAFRTTISWFWNRSYSPTAYVSGPVHEGVHTAVYTVYIGKAIIRNCFLIVFLSHRSGHEALENKTQLSQILLLNLCFIFRVYSKTGNKRWKYPYLLLTWHVL
jgi:hypothetical protein